MFEEDLNKPDTARDCMDQARELRRNSGALRTMAARGAAMVAMTQAANQLEEAARVIRAARQALA